MCDKYISLIFIAFCLRGSETLFGPWDPAWDGTFSPYKYSIPLPLSFLVRVFPQYEVKYVYPVSRKL